MRILTLDERAKALAVISERRERCQEEAARELRLLAEHWRAIDATRAKHGLSTWELAGVDR